MKKKNPKMVAVKEAQKEWVYVRAFNKSSM